MNLLNAATELGGVAKEAGLPLDKLVHVLSVLDARQTAEQNERRAMPAEKEAIAKALGDLNGAITPDLPISEILARAGVRKAQGTSAYAKRELKNALLTFNKS